MAVTCDYGGVSGNTRVAHTTTALLDLRKVAVNDVWVTALGDNIRDAREQRGMTQLDLAAAVGVSESTVSNWERGARAPKNKLGKIRQVLDLGAAAEPPVQRPLSDCSDAELLGEIASRFARSRQRPGRAVDLLPGKVAPPEVDGQAPLPSDGET